MILPAGQVKIELGKADVAAAVEFWLQEKVVKVPCAVAAMEVVDMEHWQSAIFTVTLVEEGTEAETETVDDGG